MKPLDKEETFLYFASYRLGGKGGFQNRPAAIIGREVMPLEVASD